MTTAQALLLDGFVFLVTAIVIRYAARVNRRTDADEKRRAADAGRAGALEALAIALASAVGAVAVFLLVVLL